ncbi:MAG: hypothetical protein UT82_C0014G0048 [Parcubacteria group bacterium GW2011_GWB1_40_14]|nr:MAG: hypothetical protein UT82_C0014G0048 [Parcubacteria group bacterium GW2011_GWB1_40_14]
MNKLTQITSTMVLASLLMAPVAFADNDSKENRSSNKPAKAKKFELTGVVFAVDSTANTVTVKNVKGNKVVRGKTEVVVMVVTDTKITKNGKAAILADIKIRDTVQARGTLDGEKLVATKLNARSAKFELTGDVVSHDTSAKKITLTVKTANKIAREFKTKQLVITYNDNTKIVLKKGIVSLADIKTGVRVNVKGVAEGDAWIASRIAVLGKIKQSTNTTNTEVKTTAKVEITENGFVPPTVTIKKGGTVTWENEATALAWPASDPHPAHTGLAGFDAGLGLVKDATYSFIFNTAGTFGYHDHLNVTHTGTVKVVE